MPPRLAGREQVMQELKHLLSYLNEDNRSPPGDAVLYGPRGNGKTVLLTAFRQQCAGVDVLSLTAANIKNEAKLASHLLYDDSRFGKFLEIIRPARSKIDLKIAAAEWDRMSRKDRDNYRSAHLVDLLLERCHNNPLVVTLDEAHTLDIEVGHTLLNVSQSVRTAGAPFLLVLAGTPNLESHLNRMSSTFWNRATIIGVERLSEAGACEAITAPLDEYGIAFNPAALETVVTESQRYPYFIQLWGQALCRELKRNMTNHIDTGVVDAVRPRFTEGRNGYYEHRYGELRKQGLLSVAHTAAGAFEGQDSIWDDELHGYLSTNASLDADEALEVLERLSDLGYIWKPVASARYEPGIPSLMTYLLKERKA